jgi:hypothetical protein
MQACFGMAGVYVLAVPGGPGEYGGNFISLESYRYVDKVTNDIISTKLRTTSALS